MLGRGPSLLTGGRAAVVNLDTEEPVADEHGAIRLGWQRIGLFDLVAMYVIFEYIIYFWDLFSTDFIVF
jgi:hypothetical protein